MPTEYKYLINTLKHLLKEKGITYQELSKEMRLSLASVKRILNSEDGPINRVSSICDIIEISFIDLVQLSSKNREDNYFYLSKKNEEFFAKNHHYFCFFRLIHGGKWSIKKIQKMYGLSNNAIFKYLNKLDQMGIIELRANNQFRFLVKGHFRMDPNKGPLYDSFWREKTQQFINYSIANHDQPDYLVKSSDCFISPHTYNTMKDKLEILLNEYNISVRRDNLIYKQKDMIYTGFFSSFGKIPWDIEDMFKVKEI